MKNLLSFNEFLNEGLAIEFNDDQQNLFLEIGEITDASIKEIIDLCKKNKSKTVSRGKLGGVNIVDSKKNILFDVIFFPSNLDKKTQIIYGVSKNPTTDYKIASGLPFQSANELKSQLRAASDLIDNFQYIQNPKGIKSLTDKAVKEYREFIDGVMDGIKRNFEYLNKGNFIE